MMNISVTLGVASSALCLLWLVQTAVLKISGNPLTWPLRYETSAPVVRWTGRLMVQVVWLIILIGTPLALGIPPIDELRQAFPTPVPWREIAIAFLIVFLPACASFALYITVGWVRIEPKFDQKTRRGKFFRRFLTPLPLAAMEEGVFRGIFLEQLIQAMPQSYVGSALAIVLSSALFSSTHFIKRPAPNIPVFQQAWGFFMGGCLFGLAYIVGGHSLWLPIAMHATAIFVIEMTRLYMAFNAPRWLAGYSESPQSGLLGSIATAGMCIALLVLV
jgi:hypothetical protein